MRNAYAVGLIVLTMFSVTAPAFAQNDGMGRYNIMRPEPGVPPKYKSPRGSTEHVVIPPSTEASQTLPQTTLSPSFVVPQTGQVVPSQPVLVPSGPNRTETYQDRAVRCATQAGSYAGDRNAFVGSCITQ